jgi:general secretion pathway protein B
MSYILDALKKSDEDRQRRRPASLDTLYAAEVEKPKKKSPWPYLVVCILVLNAGLLLWWLRPWNPGQSAVQNLQPVPKEQHAQVAKEAVRTPPAVPREKPGGGVPQKQEGKEQAKKDSQNQPVPPPAAAPVEKSNAQAGGAEQPPAIAQNTLKMQAPPSQPPAVTNEAAQSAAPAGGNVTGPQPPTVRSEAAAPSEVINNPVPEPPKPGRARVADAAPAAKTPPPTTIARMAVPPRVPEAPTQEDLSKKARAKAAVADAKVNKQQHAALEQAIPVTGSKELVSDLKSLTASEKPAGKAAGSGTTARVQDLPSPVRDSLPRLSVSMLIYSAKPGDRFININGSRTREGQEVSAGLKVEEITPDGAVFSYQGMRFYKPVMGD